MLSNFAIALIRTYVPIGVGVVVAFLAQWGLKIDDAAVVTFIVGIASSAYYAIAFKISEHFPRFGWLLGKSSTPVYV